MFRGGGVAPSEFTGSGEPCKDNVAVLCFCASCCNGPLVWRLLVVPATIFAAAAMVVAETCIFLGVAVV